MREVYVVKPATLEVLYEGTFNDGPRALASETSVPYTLKLLRAGEDFFPDSEKTLQLRYSAGSTGGRHVLMKRPRTGGLMPRSMAEPLAMLVGYGDADVSTEAGLPKWYGMSERNVKEYKSITTSGGGLMSDLSNVKFFSYNGGLFFVGEFTMSNYDVPRSIVCLYKYNETDQVFSLAYRFHEAVIDDDSSGEAQTGSPVALEVNGDLVVLWRTVDRQADKNHIVAFKSSGSLTDWTQICNFEVPNTLSSAYVSFRMRAAVGPGCILLCWFAISEPDELQRPEFRSFLSLDDGQTFIPNEERLTGVLDSEDVLLQSQSLHPHFVPEFPEDVDEDEYTNWGVNFDMYFDENMGSFVVLKAGDPNPDTPFFDDYEGRNFLMGIKTVDGDFTSWEPCLKLAIDYRVTGITDDSTPFGSAPSPDLGQYFIDDISISPEGAQHSLAMTVRERSTGAYTDNGVVLGEFCFLDRSQVFPGNYDKVLAYGDFSHERYGFACTPLSVEQSGLTSVGSRMSDIDSNTLEWEGLSSCIWRSQLVVTARPSELSGNTFFAVCGPWSNLGEDCGYQLSYTPHLGIAPWQYHMTTGVTASPTVDYDDSTALTTITANTNGDYAYISTDPIASTSEPPDWRAARHVEKDFKIKFQIKFTSSAAGSSWTEVLRVNLGDPASVVNAGREFAARFRGDGNIDLVSYSGAVFETLTPALDWSNTYEMVFRIGRTFDGPYRIVFAYRVLGSEEWLWVGFNNQVPQSTGGGDPYTRLGIIDYSGFADQEVEIGYIQMGTDSSYYRPVFSALRASRGRSNLEPMNRASGWRDGYQDEPFLARSARFYSNKIELKDGTLLHISGPTGSKDYGVDFNYANTPSKNSVLNLLDALPGSVFDFTYQLDADDGCEVFLRNPQGENLDAFSLVNLVGVTGVRIRGGLYDEEAQSWTEYSESTYAVPYEILNVVSSTDNVIVVGDEDFPNSSLRGQIICRWDGTEYTDQHVVTDNFGPAIVVASPVSTLGVGEEYRLMNNSATYELTEAVGEGSEHISIRFQAVSGTSYACCGSVVAGRLVDLTAYVDSLSEAISSESDLIEGDRGYDFMTDPFALAVTTSATLEFSVLGFNDDGGNRIMRLFNSLSYNRTVFPLVEVDSSSRTLTRLAVVSEGCEISPQGFARDASVGLKLASWEPTFSTTIDLAGPYIDEILFDDSNPESGDSVTYDASAYDPAGGSLSYFWNFDDGPLAWSETQTGTYTWDTEGSYVVALTVTSSITGKTFTKYARVFVED